MTPERSPDAALLYLTAIQEGSVRALDVSRRLFFASLVLASILVALALGVVRADDQFVLIGLKLKLDVWVPLSALCVLAVVLLATEVAHHERGHRLAWRAAQLYRHLGFATPAAEWHSADSPFTLPYVTFLIETRVSGKWLSYRRAAFIGQSIAVFVTLIAQILVLNRFRQDFGWTLPVFMFTVVPMATMVVGVGRVMVLAKAPEADGRPWL